MHFLLPLALVTSDAAYLVISSGDKNPATAAQQRDAYLAAGCPQHDDFPRVIASAEVEGLKPGFHVVAVAAPNEERVAKRVVAELKRCGIKGAYYRAVAMEGEALVVATIKPRACAAEGSVLTAVAEKTEVAKSLVRAKGTAVLFLSESRSKTFVHSDACPDLPIVKSGTLFPGWRVIIALPAGGDYDGEDYGVFSSEIAEIGNERGFAEEGQTKRRRVSIERFGSQVATREVWDGPGYLFAEEGKPDGGAPHEVVSIVLEAASKYFGVELTQ